MRLKNISRGLKELISIRSFYDFKTYTRKLILFILNISRFDSPFSEVPSTLQIEPTNYCNLQCICCASSRSTRKKGYLDFDLFKKIIDDASQIGVRDVDLFLHGEPLLHPYLDKMIQYIKSKHLRVEIATNAMALNREKMKAILHSGLDRNDRLRFSILGHSKETHEKIQSGVNHERVIKNVFEFLELQKKIQAKGPTVKIAFYVVPENEHEKKLFMKYWQGKVDQVMVPNASKSFREYKRRMNVTSPRKKYCWDLWSRMTIFWNGDVTVCCLDVDGDFVFGNLRNETIREIWNNEKLISLKKTHKERNFQKFPLCAKCDF